MPAYNLVRNARVFFTTNVNANTGAIPTSGSTISNTNTFELLVLNGFSFTQTTQQQTISLNEAGNTPSRGSRSFNTSVDPVEFSFATYIRPGGSGPITADESVLWNALLSSDAVDGTGISLASTTLTRVASAATATIVCTAANLTTAGIAAGTVVNIGGVTGSDGYEWNAPATIVTATPSYTAATTITVAYADAPAGAGTAPVSAPTTLTLKKGAWVNNAANGTASGSVNYGNFTKAYAATHTAGSNKNQLQKFGMYVFVDSVLYAIDDCVLDSANIEFSTDGISQVKWAGKGRILRQINTGANTATTVVGSPGVFSGTGNATGTAAAPNDAANYITNKLSTATLVAGLRGTGTAYNIAITGGSLTINNNVSYLTPENLGVVNTAIGYFTGQRSISGSLTAYLKTGSNGTAQLLNDMLTNNVAETKYSLQVEVGGATNNIHVDFDMNGCMLQIPTVETADIMSTTINFTAQGIDPLVAANSYDLGASNDLTIRYFSA